VNRIGSRGFSLVVTVFGAAVVFLRRRLDAGGCTPLTTTIIDQAECVVEPFTVPSSRGSACRRAASIRAPDAGRHQHSHASRMPVARRTWREHARHAVAIQPSAM
jgi:hypothetical protein